MTLCLTNKYLKNTFSTLLFLFAAQNLNAEEARWYQIETVIFTHQSTDNNEHWYHHNPINQPEHLLELITHNQWQELQAQPSELTAIENEFQQDLELQKNTTVITNEKKNEKESTDNTTELPAYVYLDEEQQTKLPYLLDRLNKYKNYRILFKGAWRQPLEENDSLPIHVQGGKRYNNISELDGYLKLRVKRYLHISANLQFTLFTQVPQKESLFINPMQNIDFSQPDWAANQQWHPALYNPKFIPMENIILNQSRRMRSKELHYLDNPRLGLLVYITPHEINQEDTKPNDSIKETSVSR